MAPRNNLTKQHIHPTPLDKRMLQGAGIALIMIIFFLLGAGEPDPDWPKLWMIKPLLMVPLSGALGGVFYYYLHHLRYQGGWRKPVTNLLSLILFIIVLWLGTVLGLDGTWWD